MGEPIAPVFARVQELIINTDKRTLIFFGNGIDVDNPRTIYEALLEHHNMLEEAKENQKKRLSIPQININLPKIDMPKIGLSSFKLQSPIVRKKTEKKNSEDEK